MTYKLTINKKLILIGAIALFLFLLSSQTSQAACADVPLTGSYIVSASCTFSASTGVFGVDEGGITIDANQGLTINDGQTIVWGPNESIVINGTIAINNGGQLKQARIWVKDADEDGYPTDDAHEAQTGSPGAGYRYRSQLHASMTYTTDLDYDCNDTDDTLNPDTICSDGNCNALADWTSCGTDKVCLGIKSCADKVSLSGTQNGSLDHSGKAVIVESGNTVTVTAYNGSSYGSLTITAAAIKVEGTITASGKGFGGGGGGKGGYGGGMTQYCCCGGAGVAGGSNGANSSCGQGVGGGDAGAGGNGGGSYGGTKGSRGARGGCSGCHGHNGGAGQRGGYAVSQGQGDSTTDETLNMGSAGGGGGGGGGASGLPYNGWSGAGGGGGAGGRGGGWIKLYATSSILVSGNIYAQGMSNAGNGGKGANSAGPGGNGGSAASAGSCSGGAKGDATRDGGVGGGGGYGAGGGILLKAPGVSLTGSYVIDNRGGGSSTTNGGTVKIFYQGAAPDTANIYKGSLYTTTY